MTKETKQLTFSIAQLMYEVAQLVVLIAASCAASSAVMAAISGLIGWLLACCAGFGAVFIAASLMHVTDIGVVRGSKYLAHRYDAFIARRRNERFFSVIDC